MKQLLLVFVGGGFGSTLRFLIIKAVNNSQNGFPYATFTANILGSLIIGFVLGLVSKSNMLTQNHTLLIATGFCGGLTTFSTFAYENLILLKAENFLTFALYTFFSFVIGLLAVFIGMYLVKYV